MYCKLNNGKIKEINNLFNVGDYVYIIETGQQYSTYTTAFCYFFGEGKSCYLESKKEKELKVWKVINIAVHGGFENDILYHIRNCEGKNVVIHQDGLELAPFHNRNRTCIKEKLIFQIPPSGNYISNNWRDKLWDFYEDGKIIENKNKKF